MKDQEKVANIVYFKQKSKTHHALDYQRLALIISQIGLPHETHMATGLKEGSYWEQIARKYVNGTSRTEPSKGNL